MNLRVYASGLAKSHLSTRRAHPALLGAGLDWEAGRLHVLTGPNGAGKTTLLRILAGLDHADAGQIKLVNPRTSSLVEADPYLLRSVCAWLPDRPGFPSSLTARQAMEEVLILDGVDALSRKEIIRKAQEQFQLHAILDRPAPSCSRGQQAQLAFARMSILDRYYWWLDEPFAALDQDAVERVCEWIQQKVIQGQLVALCTHNADGGPALARHWPFPVMRWVVNSGQIERSGDKS